MVASDGAVLNDVTYDSYGNIIAQSHPENADRFAWAGGERDAGTGMQIHLHRWYDPATGRWISQDPLGFAAGDRNLDRYVGNGPTNGADPRGLVFDTNFDKPEKPQANPPAPPAPGPSWNFYKWLYTGDPYTPDAIYESAMQEAGDYLYEHSPIRGVYGFLGWESPKPEAIGQPHIYCEAVALTGYSLDEGLWWGGLLAGGGEIGWGGADDPNGQYGSVAAGVEITNTNHPVEPIILYTVPVVPIGGFWTPENSGVFVFKKWDTPFGEISLGGGFEISNENCSNLLNWDYYMGKLPKKN